MDIVADCQGPNPGAKRTGVVLVHGLTGTPVEMKPLEKYLSKSGIEVENVLLAGHGSTNEAIVASTWRQWLDSVRDGVKKILSTNDRVIICGLSMGSLLASKVAAEESRVSGLVLMSPTLKYDGSVLDNSLVDLVVTSELPRRIMHRMVRLLPLLGKHCYWEELPPYGIRDERIQKQITKSIQAAKKGGNNEFGVFRTYYGPLAEMLELVEHARTALAKVRVPVLVMQSLDDTICSINNSTEAYLNLGSNNKALFLLSGCDHVMTLDLQRNLVHKMVGRFVAAFSEPNTESNTVRSVLTPVLKEARFAKGGSLSAMISPEMHGLNRTEWKALYPGRRYAHLASVADVHELHSLVLRDQAEPVMSLPVFIGEYSQNAYAASKFSQGGRQAGASAVWRQIAGLLTPPEATVLGLGSYIHELPGLGLNQEAGVETQSKSYANMIRIIDSLAKSARVDACTNIQQQIPELPQPAVILRANDKKQVLLNKRVSRLLEGQERFYHRNILREAFARFIQVSLPDMPSAGSEEFNFESAVSAG